MKNFHLLIIFSIVLSSCQEEPFPYAKHEIKFIGYENAEQIVISERSYRSHKPNLTYFVRKPNSLFKFELVGPYIDKFNCSVRESWYGETIRPDKNSYFEIEIDHNKMSEINISCRYIQSQKEKKFYRDFPNSSHYKSMDEEKEIKTLPYIKNLDYVLLDQFGYSPYNHSTPYGDSAKRYHYQENRDRESISFINTNQEGITFFYDEKGFTNITIDETYCPDELHKELQKLGDFNFIEGSGYTVTGSWQDFSGSYQDRFCGSYIRK